MDNTFDQVFYDQGKYIAGVDESGTIDIAGPVVAACVIFPKFTKRPENLRIFEIDDCKVIPEKYRKQYVELIWDVAEAVGIAEVAAPEIDYFGPRHAARLAMLRAVHACARLSNQKPLRPDFMIVDGTRRVPVRIKQTTVIDADRKSLSVAAASIVAKVYRDDIMMELHKRFPYYQWDSNKGYPCDAHFKGIDSHGIQIGIHRARYWPFAANTKDRKPKLKNKNPEEVKQHIRFWKKRRQKWKRVTEKTLGIELGEGLWTSNPPLLLHSLSSRKPSPEGESSGTSTKSLNSESKQNETPATSS